jgi:hypothetical protein
MKLLCLIVMLLTLPVMAANWYIVPGGAGSKNGTSLANAWNLNSPNGISWASVSPGDTVWLAGGDYSTLQFGIPWIGNGGTYGGTAANRIFVKRILATDVIAGTSVTNMSGWTASYDSLAKVKNILIQGSSYITIDGRTNYGIQVEPIGSQVVVGPNQPCTNLVFTGIELYGGDVNGTGGNTGYGFVASYDEIQPDMIVSNCWVHDDGNGFSQKGLVGLVLTHCLFQDFWTNTSAGHVDCTYSFNYTNVTICDNVFSNCQGDGIYWSGLGGVNTNVWFYNNVVMNFTGNTINPGSPSLAPNAVYFFNNTIYNAGWYGQVGLVNYRYINNYFMYNNVIYNTTLMNQDYGGLPGSNPVLDSYNAFNASSAGGEVGAVLNLTTNQFLNGDAGNFGLSSGSVLRSAGTNLSSFDTSTAPAGVLANPFTVDMNGNVRPSGTTKWDIGPYQYSSGGTSTQPGSFHIVPGGAGKVALTPSGKGTLTISH